MQHATQKTIGTTTIKPDEVERFSRIAEEWWDENGKFKPLHRINPLRLQFIRDHVCKHFGRNPDTLKMLSGLTLLDIGCGGGLLCEPLTRLGATVTGIDASEKNIKVASLHAEQMGLSIDYRATTPERLAGVASQGSEANRGGATAEPERGKRSPTQQYDIVLALEIIEHVEDVPLFMQSVCSLVKPGGLLFMSTLNRTLKSYALAIVGAEYVLRWLPVGTHSWNQFVKPSELAKYLRDNQVELMEQTGMTFNPIKNRWSLNPTDLDVNYLLVAKK
jgi:2-polyprenyl-6-hydroxyphenyl methylase / 3-demethylubiquinone-9 3-methyltransferase